MLRCMQGGLVSGATDILYLLDLVIFARAKFCKRWQNLHPSWISFIGFGRIICYIVSGLALPRPDGLADAV